MAAHDRRANLPYLNKLLEKYSRAVMVIIILLKNPIDANYSTLTENIKTNPKANKLKVNDRVMINNY